MSMDETLNALQQAPWDRTIRELREENARLANKVVNLLSAFEQDTQTALDNADVISGLKVQNFSLRMQYAKLALEHAAAAQLPTSDNPVVGEGVVDNVVDALNRRVVPPPDRTRLRDALDKADAPQTGRAGADEALGRAIRFGGSNAA